MLKKDSQTPWTEEVGLETMSICDRVNLMISSAVYCEVRKLHAEEGLGSQDAHPL